MTKPVAFIISAILFLQTTANCEVLDSIDAVVNGELILSGEVDSVLRNELGGQSLIEEQMVLKRREVLEKLIDTLLILQEARKVLRADELNAIADEMDRLTNMALEQQRSNFSSPEDLKRFEREQLRGMRWEDYRKMFARNQERAYLQNRVAPRLAQKVIKPPTTQELNTFKQQHPELSPEDEIEIARIFLALPQNATVSQIQAVEARANELSIRARSGEDFERLVRQYSDDTSTKQIGGRMGSFQKDSISSDFAFLFDKPESFISDPVKTGNGFNIIKIVNIPTWEEVYFDIKNQENVNEWIKGVRAKADVNIRYDEVLQKKFDDLKEEYSK